MSRMTLAELRAGEEGERLNLKSSYKWILHEMEYEDFVKFAQLHFETINYPFSYRYMITKDYDTPKARENYLKYLMYKLYQNLETPDVRLAGEEKE